jgi:hypothetical protein
VRDPVVLLVHFGGKWFQKYRFGYMCRKIVVPPLMMVELAKLMTTVLRFLLLLTHSLSGHARESDERMDRAAKFGEDRNRQAWEDATRSGRTGIPPHRTASCSLFIGTGFVKPDPNLRTPEGRRLRWTNKVLVYPRVKQEKSGSEGTARKVEDG